jgi:hypothetical protein
MHQRRVGVGAKVPVPLCPRSIPPSKYIRKICRRSWESSFKAASRWSDGLRAENASIWRSIVASLSWPRRIMNASRAGPLWATISANSVQAFLSVFFGMRHRWLSSQSAPPHEEHRRSVFNPPAASARLADRHAVQM